MIVLFTGLPGSGKTTVLATFLKYLLEETRLRVCTVDLDCVTAKLTRILTPGVEVLCDLYDVVEDVCNNVTHVVLSDRHVHVPVRLGQRRQDSDILDLLQELYSVLEVDLVLVDSVEPQLASIADRRTFKIVHVVRPDIAEYYDLARQEDIIVINSVVPSIEPKLKHRKVLYLHFDPVLKICLDLKTLPSILLKDVTRFCKSLLSLLKSEAKT